MRSSAHPHKAGEDEIGRQLDPEISSACARTDVALWTGFARAKHSHVDDIGAGRLVFSTYRGGAIRVSEQEARFAFVEAMCAGPLRYSIEAPTSKLYQFTGRFPLSAQTDLSVYDAIGNRICNVEFKAKGISPSAEKHLAIYKDLQKLMREPLWGLWFHLLESVNNATINHFLSVLAMQIDRVRADFEEDLEAPGLTIHVCVLQHGFSIQRNLIPDNRLSQEELHQQLRLDLSVLRLQLLRVNDANGWNLHALAHLPPT